MASFTLAAGTARLNRALTLFIHSPHRRTAMVTKHVRWIAGLILLSLTLIVGAQEPQPERFLLTFIPNIQFSPMYVSIEQGYFSEAGYDVSLEYLNEPDVIDLVAAGQVHFGVASGEQVILANAR